MTKSLVQESLKLTKP